MPEQPGFVEDILFPVLFMAAYISVPRDLTQVKSKILFNLTKRQLICFTAGAAAGVPLFFALKSFIPVSTAVLCMMVVMLPMFFLGMYERDGQPAEKVARQFIEAKFIRPKERPYQTNNYYAALERQAWAEKEVMEIVHEYERSKAEKNRKFGS